jgi:hypothetical protein
LFNLNINKKKNSLKSNKIKSKTIKKKCKCLVNSMILYLIFIFNKMGKIKINRLIYNKAKRKRNLHSIMEDKLYKQIAVKIRN